MFEKKIYDEWKLHADATQHEIDFKFLDKSIKIMMIKKLLDDNKTEIIDEKTIKRWQQIQLVELLNQYNEISHGEDLTINESSDFFYKYVLNLASIIVSLRRSNIKINDLEHSIEPKLFRFVINTFNLQQINDFYNLLLQDLFSNDENTFDSSIKFSLKIDDATNVRNTVWNLENLCLSFKELERWYQGEKKVSDVEKRSSLNLILVYNIVNFYIRYINDLNGGIINYNRIYNSTIFNFKEIIREKKPLVLIAFKLIAIFLNVLVKKYNFEKNDSIIVNYLSIISICCNDTNCQKLKEIIFNEINSF